MFKQSKEQRQAHFELTLRVVREEGKTAAAEANFHHYSTQMSYLDAALTGGKMNTDEVAIRAKDLYKAWKDTNKSIHKE